MAGACGGLPVLHAVWQLRDEGDGDATGLSGGREDQSCAEHHPTDDVEPPSASAGGLRGAESPSQVVPLAHQAQGTVRTRLSDDAGNAARQPAKDIGRGAASPNAVREKQRNAFRQSGDRRY